MGTHKVKRSEGTRTLELITKAEKKIERQLIEDYYKSLKK